MSTPTVAARWMDDGLMGTVPGVVSGLHHDQGARGSADKGRWEAFVDACRRRCCAGQQDDEPSRGCTAVVCCSVYTRTMLVVVNLTFLLAGWTFIGVGLWIHIFQESVPFGILFRDNPTAPMLVVDRLPLALIGAGAIVTVIGFLGCCGACTESVCFLGFYAVLLVLSFVAQVAIATLAIMYHNQVRESLLTSMLYQIRYQYNKTGQYSNKTDNFTYQITIAWDKLQNTLECCGAYSPGDYHDSLWFNNSAHSEEGFVPTSCCLALVGPDYSDTECQNEALRYTDAIGDVGNAKGCHAAVIDKLSEYLPFVFFLLSLDLLQLMNVVYACMLINLVRRKQVDYSWCEDDEID